jgi:hypothetical protein
MLSAEFMAVDRLAVSKALIWPAWGFVIPTLTITTMTAVRIEQHAARYQRLHGGDSVEGVVLQRKHRYDISSNFLGNVNTMLSPSAMMENRMEHMECPVNTFIMMVKEVIWAAAMNIRTTS